ncbi:MAG: hypothetical protein B7Y45_02005 [Sphingomonas sp. 28-66-16]|nr:MAG: hypothetical protein B7Y45_02005 [Sphingomonas sp. 28-66-16]
MKMKLPLVLAASAALAACGDASAQRRGDQQEAFDQMRNGRILPLKEIERRVLPVMGNTQYIGVNFDSASGIYTLKFLRNGNVIWVDVDGRSGQIIGRSGN